MWPTLLIIDSATEQPLLRWGGAATVPQLEKLLDDGERSAKGGDELARADRLAADGKPADAASAYRQALDRVDPSRRGRVLEALELALEQEHDDEGCAKTALAWLPKLPPGSSRANVASAGLSCAVGAPPTAPWRAEAMRRLTAEGVEALKTPGLLADDRSGLYESLVDAKSATGDAAGAHALALAWLDFLEKEAARAPNAEARAAFDPHRLNAAIAAGEPQRAVPPLLQSEKDLPNDYNPPARLAIAYRELGRLDDALAASDRALQRAYGPRRIRILEVKASIYQKKHDAAGARAAIEQAIAIASSLPAAQHGPEQVARLKKQLAAQH